MRPVPRARVKSLPAQHDVAFEEGSFVKLTPQHLAEIVNALSTPGNAGKGAEKRRATRLEVQGNVVIAPVLPDGTVGQSFTAITRDISFVGVGLLQSRAMKLGEAVVIRLPRGSKDPLFVVSKVQHVRPLAEGLYVIGAEFTNISGISEQHMLGRAGENERNRVQQLILN